MSIKTDVFKEVLNKFETSEMRNYCMDMIDKMEDFMFTIPASTSLKYHNATQCQPSGQVYHVIMASTIMNYILSLDYIKEKYPKEKHRDALRAAILLHDGKKSLNGSYTVFEHPLLAQEWILETNVEHDISMKIKEYIGELVASHSGQWTTNKKSKAILPKPDSDDKFIVHLCDYLSSRPDIDMIYSDYVKMCMLKFSNPVKYVFQFGKHKGSTIEEVIEKDPSYIDWAKDNIEREPLKSILKSI